MATKKGGKKGNGKANGKAELEQAVKPNALLDNSRKRAFVYCDRDTGMPYYRGEPWQHQYTDQMATSIEQNFNDTGTALRRLLPLDKVIAWLYRNERVTLGHVLDPDLGAHLYETTFTWPEDKSAKYSPSGFLVKTASAVTHVFDANGEPVENPPKGWRHQDDVRIDLKNVWPRPPARKAHQPGAAPPDRTNVLDFAQQQ